MNQALHTWQFIMTKINAGEPVILLYVLESIGSSPGRQGFFMAVSKDGDMQGSIGGGIMEHKFVEMAKEQLAKDNVSLDVKKQIHDKSAAANQSGMICSGEQTILILPISQNDSDKIHLLIDSLTSQKNGTIILSNQGFDFINTIPTKDFDFQFINEKNWIYKEKTGFKNKLFIIGGGHCSLALSELMHSMDFYIQVFDTRPSLKTMNENKAAQEMHLVDDYSLLQNIIPSGEQHYVVIMTFGYRTDDVALRALLDKKFKYLGVLGSKNKMEKLFDEYRKAGIAQKTLAKIHTPIGLQIHSQTPEEIAVSIAAEIIRTKNSIDT